MNRDLNTPIWQLTAGEFIELIAEHMKPEQPEQPVRYDDNLVYGIPGISKLLGVSKCTVHEYRKQGWIEPAISQVGKKIICNAPLALKLYNERAKSK
ncbi:MAG: DUF3853 family protein [Prevotellaceae bacterium]|jgi:hypothetical protein|nr:DUF3853 family protein [Prevotellaceae bacterium]